MTTIDEEFQRQQARLMGIAYRMLGNPSDAEDIVQDAWIRCRNRPSETVENPAAFLAQIVTRLSIDALRRRQRSQANYSGPWLPTPVIADDRAADGEEKLALAQTLSVALLVMLEKLSPNERAAFILREAYQLNYDDIAGCLDARAATCRQWVRRARQQLAGVEWHDSQRQTERKLLERFQLALSDGDVDSLVALLSEQVVLVSDGGGKVLAATQPVEGRRAVSRFLIGLAARRSEQTTSEFATLNGGVGLLVYFHGKLETVATVACAGDQISAIHIQRNPDKINAISPIQ